jgi:hypothetical protein
MLRDGDLVLLDAERNAISQWQWQELFSHERWLQEMQTFRLAITPQGAKKV